MSSGEKDLTQGSLLKKIIIFALPVIGVNILQLLFNTADIVVVGRFVPEELANAAVGAVGATTPIINLMIGFFIGLSIGANVVVSRCAGRGDTETARKAVGTSVALSLVAGILLATGGVFCSRMILKLTNCEAELLDMATDYLTIYFIGMPVIMFYNFAAAILRAVGDTLKPFIFLLAGGIINVVLNVVLVSGFGMTADGVAIATVASNAVSAVCCFITLIKSKGFARLEIKRVKFYGAQLREILGIGVPSGIQAMLFAVSNVIIQSAVNSYGDLATAGNAVSSTIDNYVYESTNGFAVSVLSFVGQNLGAGKADRAKKSLYVTLGVITAVGVTTGGLCCLFGKALCYAVRPDAAVVAFALKRLYILAPTYFLCGLMNTYAYTMRGMGKSFVAMLISLFGACLLRIIWIYAIKALFPSQIILVYVSYPATWIITILIYLATFYPTFNKVKNYESTEDIKR